MESLRSCIKQSEFNRTPSRLRDGNVPIAVLELFGTDRCKPEVLEYNGGGYLVDYGLNAFVKNIYIYNGKVVCVDYLGNCYQVKDPQLASIIQRGNLVVSAEGFLIFYLSTMIYVTLDCKLGSIYIISNLLGGEKVASCRRVFVSKGWTYLEVAELNAAEYIKYKLFFQLQLGRSPQAFRPIIYLQLKEVPSENSQSPKIIDMEFEEEIFSSHVESNDDVKMLSLSCCTYYENRPLLKALKREFKHYISSETRRLSMKDTYYENIKVVLGERSWCAHVSLDNDSSFHNGINAMVFDLYFFSIDILKGWIPFLKCREKHQSYIVARDRFGEVRVVKFPFLNSVTYFSNDIKFYVSIEGVIIMLFEKDRKFFMLFSLDGVQWKIIELEKYFNKGNKNLKNLEINSKNGRTYISEKNWIDDYAYTTDKFYLNFSFDFWSLYQPCVSVTFEKIEEEQEKE